MEKKMLVQTGGRWNENIVYQPYLRTWHQKLAPSTKEQCQKAFEKKIRNLEWVVNVLVGWNQGDGAGYGDYDGFVDLFRVRIDEVLGAVFVGGQDAVEELIVVWSREAH